MSDIWIWYPHNINAEVAQMSEKNAIIPADSTENFDFNGFPSCKSFKEIDS